MSKPLLSIIVPAYNAEDSIGKLIESVISQNYDDYELIVVNDGSKDKTKEVIESYLDKSDKLIFIDKENTGVGDTRNRGIERAQGKYITFADSDDYYCDNFFEKIIPEIKKENFELLVFNANVINYGECVGKEIPDKYKEGYFECRNGVIKYLNGKFCYQIANVPWNKIYIGDIIKNNNLKYNPNKKRGQDLLFNILYVSMISKYKYVNEKLYNYNLNYDGVKNKTYFEKSINNLLEYYEPVKEICIDSNIRNYERYLGLFFLRRFPGVVLNETNNPDKIKGKANIQSFLDNENIKYILKKVKIRNMDFKLFICFILYKFKLYKLMYNILWNKKNKKRN